MEESATAVLVYHNTVSILPGSRVFKVILFFFFISTLFKVTCYSVFFTCVSEQSHGSSSDYN